MLDKTYTPTALESRLYQAWEQAGVFSAGNRPQAQPYTIMIPPPNVTGKLHIGHGLTMSLQDILIRYHRMQGYDTLWQPGTDHAGIATQMTVEKQLAEQGITRRDLGREKFLARVWQWKAESEGQIKYQLQRLGASLDWGRDIFTMDEGCNLAVRTVFVQLYQQGLIYRDKRLVNWDPSLRTAISDLEVESRQVQGALWYFNYPIDGEDERFITVATTRPETILGDTAIAVHPDDPRYRDLIGRQVRLPLMDRLIPIIGDLYADRETGSGAVKITPAHDFNDFEVGRRHNLSFINILDAEARILAQAECFMLQKGRLRTEDRLEPLPTWLVGLSCEEARQKIVDWFTEQGLCLQTKACEHNVPFGDRSGVPIEPWLTDQWYCDAEKLAGPALRAVEQGRTRIIPGQWEKVYYDWMRNIQPWCISRQLWWGHQIPAWYGPEDRIFVALTQVEAETEAAQYYGNPVELHRDEDVLDTWFSSALWPFSTLGWPDKGTDKGLHRHYPGNVLVTGFDIIFFWVARMMMMGLHFQRDEKGEGVVPFHTVYIHALIRDAFGQKMSKSKGNVIDPLDLIDRYGADALRFTMAAMAAQGRDIKLAESRVEGYRNFATKLWNATRFCLLNECRPQPDFNPALCQNMLNRWIITKIDQLADQIADAITNYRFNEAAELLYQFIWHELCDWYLEFIKPLLNTATMDSAETRATAAWVLDRALHLLHPMMPFITEELWQTLHGKPALIAGTQQNMLATAVWPVSNSLYWDTEATTDIAWLITAISMIRAARVEANIPPGVKLDLIVIGANTETQARLTAQGDLLLRLARLKLWQFASEPPEQSIQLVLGEAILALPLVGASDLTHERDRLVKEIAKIDVEIEKIDNKLANAAFLAKAPSSVIAEQKTRREAAVSRRERNIEASMRLQGKRL